MTWTQFSSRSKILWRRQELEALEGALEEAIAHAHSADQRATVAGKELKVDTSHTASPSLFSFPAASFVLSTLVSAISRHLTLPVFAWHSINHALPNTAVIADSLHRTLATPDCALVTLKWRKDKDCLGAYRRRTRCSSTWRRRWTG
jgi:hypothetical protein